MEAIETERLLLRRSRADDAQAIFDRYASDPAVTKYMAWPTHRSLEDTRSFISFCDTQWERWPSAGPWLVFGRDGATLLGGAGLVLESADLAEAGYVFARDAWGRGYATEALLAGIACARAAGLRRLEAGVHVEHRASCRVLEKAGFVHEGVKPGQPSHFPNLPAGYTRDAVRYGLGL